jgi:hypothetical protein
MAARFDPIKDICRNETNHSESEFISMLKTAIQIDHGVVSERDSSSSSLQDTWTQNVEGSLASVLLLS